jgi:hypothetical protein
MIFVIVVVAAVAVGFSVARARLERRHAEILSELADVQARQIERLSYQALETTRAVLAIFKYLRIEPEAEAFRLPENVYELFAEERQN